MKVEYIGTVRFRPKVTDVGMPRALPMKLVLDDQTDS